MNNDLTIRFRHDIRSIDSRKVRGSADSEYRCASGNVYTLLYIVNGELLLKYDEISEPTVVGSDYAAIVAPPGTKRIACYPGPDSGFYVLEFQVAANAQSKISGAMITPCIGSVVNREGMLDFFRQHMREASSPVPSQQVLDCIASAVLSLVAESVSEEPTPNEAVPTRTADVIATQVDSFIASRFTSTIDTIDISRHLCYNTEYLERTYRQVRGMSVMSAIQRRRVHEACALLVDDANRSIGEVAKLCGYSERLFFARAFKRVMGTTPSRFRRTTGTFR